MTTAQVVETSVTVNNNSPIQDYVHLDGQTQPLEMTPGFKPFTVLLKDMFITLFIHNIFLLSASICLFLQSHQKNLKVIYFITAEWLIGK